MPVTLSTIAPGLRQKDAIIALLGQRHADRNQDVPRVRQFDV
jgi:hypothetical protein